MAQTDEQLLDAWATRESAEAFRELCERHARLVYNVCLRILRDAAAAEEVTQECFLALAGTRAPGAYLTPWLHRVATNLALKRVRGEQRQRARDTAYAAAQPSAATPRVDDLLGLVQEALNTLPEAERVPIIAHFLEGETHLAIAARLGVARPTVTVRIDRGIVKLRKILRQRGVVTSAAAITAALAAPSEAAPIAMLAALNAIALAGPVAAAAHAAPLAQALAAAALPPTAAAPFAALTPSVMAAAALLFFVAIAGLAWWRAPAATPAPAQPVAASVAVNTAPPEAPASAPLPETAPQDPRDEFTVPGKGRLSGVVVDTEGRPVRNATIEVRSDLPEAINDNSDAKHFRASTTSGDNGLFSVDLPLWRESGAMHRDNVSVKASVAGKAGTAQTCVSNLSPAGFAEVVVSDERADLISGVVLAPPGTSLAGLDVEPVPLRFLDDTPHGPITGPSHAEDDGSFILTELRRGLYAVLARTDTAPLQRMLPVATGTRNVRFQLRAGIEARVQAVDAESGGPIDLKFNLWPVSHLDMPMGHGPSTDIRPKDAGTGARIFKALAAGRYQVVSDAPDRVPAAEDLYLPISENGRKDFTVRFLSTGIVKKPNPFGPRPPISGPPPTPSAPPKNPPRPASTAAVPAAANALPATAISGSAPVPPALLAAPSAQADTNSPQYNPQQSTQAAPQYKRITGQVVDASGAPVPDVVMISISTADEDQGAAFRGPGLVAYTDEAGNFSGELVGAGPFYVQALSGARLSAAVGPLPGADLAAAPLQFALTAAAYLSGRVIDQRGEALDGINLRLEASNAEQGHIVPSQQMGLTGRALIEKMVPVPGFLTGSSGCFAFGPVSPGVYTLHAERWMPDENPYIVNTPVTLAEGADLKDFLVRMALDEGGARIEGKATILGEVAPGLRFALDSHDVQVSNARGEFRFLKVAPGAHTVELQNNFESEFDRYEWSREITIAEGERFMLDVALGGGSASIEGRVTLNGSPLPQCSLGFWPDEENGEHDWLRTFSDDNGHYRVDGLYAMGYLLKLESLGSDPWSRFGPGRKLDHTFADGEVWQHDIALGAGTVDVLFNATGTPPTHLRIIKGVQGGVSLERYTPMKDMLTRLAPSVSTPGRNRFTGLPADDYEALLIRDPDSPQESIVAYLDFTVAPASAIEITADAAGLQITKDTTETYRATP